MINNQDNESKILVKKLPLDVTEGWVHKHFVQYGTIEKINLVRDLNGCLVGAAMVVFNDLKAVALAFKGCSGRFEVSIPNNKQLKRTLSQSKKNIKQESIADAASDNSNMVVSKSTDASESSRKSSHLSPLKRKAENDNSHVPKKTKPMKSPQSKNNQLISASVYTPLNNREVSGK
jgi:hypothetical protein